MQNETVWFKPEAKGFLSLFSLGEKASGVTIRNLKYEIPDSLLKTDTDGSQHIRIVLFCRK